MLFELVLDLHGAGFPTEAGCQGRSRAEEFATKRHSPTAYLSFASPLPDAIHRALAAEGLVPYADATGVEAIALHSGDAMRAGSVRGYRKVSETHSEEDFRDDAIAAVIGANATFVARMRRAFRLPDGCDP